MGECQVDFPLRLVRQDCWDGEGKTEPEWENVQRQSAYIGCFQLMFSDHRLHLLKWLAHNLKQSLHFLAMLLALHYVSVKVCVLKCMISLRISCAIGLLH